MSFQDFCGNAQAVAALRGMLLRRRFPHGVILAGPPGAGKYTLAQMLAKTLNCQAQPVSDQLPDFCGVCLHCTRIAQGDSLDARFAEAVEAREALRDADKRDARIFVQCHPDVLVIPPDPPQMMIKVDQVRRVIQSIYFRPAEGRERVFIFTSSAFMKEAANSLLKVLEEPPESATLLLLAENPGELLPTIRSRCVTVSLVPLPAEELERVLARRRPEWKPRQRALVARLSGGAVGAALGFDLAAYVEARRHALTILASAAGQDHTELFKVTDGYRGGADGREKTEYLIRTLYSLLQDLLYLQSGAPELVRNTDIRPQLEPMAAAAQFSWLTRAAHQLGQVQSGMRRNLLRSLSLDAFAASLEPPEAARRAR
ncbi:MAG: ATP-binding protein [Terriglobales bacterium]